MLPQGDKTPDSWVLPQESPLEMWVKKPLRWILYPPYLRLVNVILGKRYSCWENLPVDQWYWGHRGSELQFMRHRVQELCRIRGKSILLAGCGTGRDIPTWLDYEPLGILGVDYFDYQRAWASLIDEYDSEGKLSFAQGDLKNLEWLADESFDIVASEAVFEHLRDLPTILQEFRRILKPGGALYAAFGPLWYCWGGDHISGYDGLASGYNHLLLEQDAYERYLDAAGEFSHSEHDGRTWIKHDMFSYLRPQEYLAVLEEAGFDRVHLSAMIEPRAIRCFREHPELKARLAADNSELDLITNSLIIIYRKANLYR